MTKAAQLLSAVIGGNDDRGLWGHDVRKLIRKQVVWPAIVVHGVGRVSREAPAVGVEGDLAIEGAVRVLRVHSVRG